MYTLTKNHYASGLSHGVYKGVLRKGYKIPTPIQRKVVLDFNTCISCIFQTLVYFKVLFVHDFLPKSL